MVSLSKIVTPQGKVLVREEVDKELMKECMPCSSPPYGQAHNVFDYSHFEVLIIGSLF